MYKIKKDDIEGWVYSKYLVDTKELAEQNYNESNTYDTHKDRKYYRELYGGKASTLDYYRYEKVEFDNEYVDLFSRLGILIDLKIIIDETVQEYWPEELIEKLE